MFKLEHTKSDEQKSKELEPNLKDLENFQNSRWKDPYSTNRFLRNQFRNEKKSIKEQKVFNWLIVLNN